MVFFCHFIYTALLLLKFNRGIAQKGTKFLITPKNIYISSTTNQMTKTTPYISFVDNTVLKIVDK